MRTGIVGLGLRAGNVLKMIQKEMPELELVGYVDPDPCATSFKCISITYSLFVISKLTIGTPPFLAVQPSSLVHDS